MTKLIKRLIKELAKRRIEKKITQIYIARKLKTGSSSISRLEAGRHSPTLLTLEKYADCIGVIINFELVDKDKKEDKKQDNIEKED